MWPFNKKIKFDTVAKFNYELDKNSKLREELNKLSLEKRNLSRCRHFEKLLELFKAEGLNISMRELDLLLLLRSKTDQILLEDDLSFLNLPQKIKSKTVVVKK